MFINFLQVNSYDKVYNEQGTFTFKAKWLIVIQKQFMLEVEESLGNIINVAAAVSGTTVSLLRIFIFHNNFQFTFDIMNDNDKKRKKNSKCK